MERQLTDRTGHRLPRGEGGKRAEQLLDAADALLTERGSERRVSIGDIVGRVGVTPPVLYRHFADKRALFRSVYERRFASFRASVQAGADQANDPSEALTLRGMAYLEYASAHPTYYRALFLDSDGLVAQIFGDPEARRQSPYQDLEDNVRACIEDGVFAEDIDVQGVVTMIWALVHGATALAVTIDQDDMATPLQEALRLGLETFVAGLRQPGGPG